MSATLAANLLRKGVPGSAPWLQLKANVATREVTGYAATWTPDEVGDRIEPGAFAATLEERHAEPMRTIGRSGIRVLWQHEQPLGVLLEVRPDDYGLWVKMRISRTALGDEALELLRDGAVDRMSIGYMVRKYRTAAGLRILTDVDLWEVSFVTFPANPAAIITGVKKLGGQPHLEFRSQLMHLMEEKEAEPVNGLTGLSGLNVELEQKAGRKIAQRNVARLEALAAALSASLQHTNDMLEECKSQPGRSEDAGGRGEPPSNHDVDRDERAGKGAPCPHCSGKGLVPSLGQPAAEPDSIASRLLPSMSQPDPEPDSIASRLVPSLGQPDPKPDSIAASCEDDEEKGNVGSFGVPEPEPESIAASGEDEELEELGNWFQDRFKPQQMPAPGSKPGGPGPFPVPAAVEYSVAQSQEANTCSSKGSLNEILTLIGSMRDGINL